MLDHELELKKIRIALEMLMQDLPKETEDESVVDYKILLQYLLNDANTAIDFVEG